MPSKRFLASGLVLLCAALAGPASGGVTAYAPLDRLRTDDLDTLVTLTDTPILTRPYPVSLLRKRVEAIEESDPDLAARLTEQIEPLDAPYGIHSLRLEGRTSSGATKQLPNARGKTTEASFDLRGAFRLAPADWVQLMLGGQAYEEPDGDTKFIPVNTYLSVGGRYLQLDMGYRDHWFGPAADSALLVSNNAPPPPSVTLSNPDPLPFLDISYELYWARLSRQSDILTDQGRESGYPKRLGAHMSLQPVQGWTLGFSRTFQYGGAGRPEGMGDVLQGFFNPSAYDNVHLDENDPSAELGDQQAAIHSALNFPGRFPMRAYFTLAGEDTSYSKNYRLGNTAFTAGLFLPRLTSRIRMRYEFSQWSTGWYTHHAYSEGNTNDGVVLGHWFGNERAESDGVGGRAHSLGLTARLGGGKEAAVTARHIRNESYSATEYDPGWEVEADVGWPVASRRMGVQLYGGRTVFGESFFSTALWVGWR